MANVVRPDRFPGAVFARVTAFLGDRPTFVRVAWRLVFGVALVLSVFWIVGFHVSEDGRYLFLDAHIYFRATQAWLDGGNPWTTTYEGVPFGGIPPTLLLNLPLIPFGEDVAVGFWAVGNTLAMALLVRRLGLPIWILLLQPVIEGWLAANPDLVLAGLILLGAGWFAVVTKPYSAPALIAKRSWMHLSVAVAIGLATIPVLPWQTFYDSQEIIAQTFADFAGHPVSAAGNPALIAIVVVALISLGWRRGWSLFTPGLLAQQPHYIVFSLDTVVRSRILSLAMTIPIAHAAAVGVIVYAAVNWWQARASASSLVIRPETA